MSRREKFLSSRDLSAIIKVCGESRVAELKFGDLHVRFDTPVEQVMRLYGDQIREAAANSTPSNRPDTAISAIQDHLAQESLERDEFDVKEDRLAQMIIENPLEAERLLIEGKLDEDADGVEEALSS
jgi:hypothetical protein